MRMFMQSFMNFMHKCIFLRLIAKTKKRETCKKQLSLFLIIIA